ncbi:MAG: helix-turn-helix transcriptional regulator [Nitrospinota bacterium]
MRKANGLTQKELEALTGFRQGVISDLERDEVKPMSVPAQEISFLLGVSFNDIWPPEGNGSDQRSLPHEICLLRAEGRQDK